MAAPALNLTEEQDLIQEVVENCYSDPHRFVCGMYPWGEPGTFLHIETGPDEWQTAVLVLLGEQLRLRLEASDQLTLTSAIRLAVASGHGVGKTALIAWIIQWFMSTRPHPQIVVMANTLPQLSNKTWRELAK